MGALCDLPPFPPYVPFAYILICILIYERGIYKAICLLGSATEDIDVAQPFQLLDGHGRHSVRGLRSPRLEGTGTLFVLTRETSGWPKAGAVPLFCPLKVLEEPRPFPNLPRNPRNSNKL